MRDPKDNPEAPPQHVVPTQVPQTQPPDSEEQLSETIWEPLRLLEVVTKQPVSVRPPNANEVVRACWKNGFPFRTNIVELKKRYYLAKSEFWPELQKYNRCDPAILVPLLSSRG